jgi:AbrB family looped-hinge helix DNA binding protein
MSNKRLKITPIVRIRRKAQVTIPVQILKTLHLDEGSYVQLSVEEGRIILEPIELKDKISGKDFLGRCLT